MYKSSNMQYLRSFTAVEIIAVLVIIGIMGATVISKMSSATDAVYGKSEVNQLAVHLAFVQAFYMNNEGVNRDYAVTLLNDGYRLRRNGNETTYTFDNAVPVSASGHVVNGLVLTFDTWGRILPSDVSAIQFTGTTVESNSITIEPETGYIDVN